jgi:hypothetical protein
MEEKKKTPSGCCAHDVNGFTVLKLLIPPRMAQHRLWLCLVLFLFLPSFFFRLLLRDGFSFQAGSRRARRGELGAAIGRPTEWLNEIHVLLFFLLFRSGLFCSALDESLLSLRSHSPRKSRDKSRPIQPVYTESFTPSRSRATRKTRRTKTSSIKMLLSRSSLFLSIRMRNVCSRSVARLDCY